MPQPASRSHGEGGPRAECAKFLARRPRNRGEAGANGQAGFTGWLGDYATMDKIEFERFSDWVKASLPKRQVHAAFQNSLRLLLSAADNDSPYGTRPTTTLLAGIVWHDG